MTVEIITEVKSTNSGFNKFLSQTRETSIPLLLVYSGIVISELMTRTSKKDHLVFIEKKSPLYAFVEECKNIKTSELISILQVMIAELSERKEVMGDDNNG